MLLLKIKKVHIRRGNVLMAPAETYLFIVVSVQEWLGRVSRGCDMWLGKHTQCLTCQAKEHEYQGR